MHLLIKDDIIKKVKFTGSGCAISQASASILTEYLTGKSAMETKNLSREDLLRILGVELSLTREKCALLALDTFKKSLR
jgi:nitrogen fixation NifU-like protein